MNARAGCLCENRLSWERGENGGCNVRRDGLLQRDTSENGKERIVFGDVRGRWPNASGIPRAFVQTARLNAARFS